MPSKANLKYRNAFLNHDEERRKTYLASLKKGDTSVRINANSMFSMILFMPIQILMAG